MSCPTCGHTMGCLSSLDISRPIFWCERCGTVSTPTDTYVPKLVQRCREFGATLGPGWGALWIRLGIAESIALPEERPCPPAEKTTEPPFAP